MERFIESHMPTFKLELRDILHNRNNEVKESDKIQIKDVYSTMEKLLEGQDYFTDVHITVVDFSYISALMVFMKHVPLNEKEYPNITAWMARCKGVVKTRTKGSSIAIDGCLTNLVMAAAEVTP